MRIDRVHLRNIRCFEDVTLTFQHAAEGDDRSKNWNVIIGENGEGKSSLMRAVALGLMGGVGGGDSVGDFSLWGWVRDGLPEGSKVGGLCLDLVEGQGDVRPGPSSRQPQSRKLGYVFIDGNQDVGLDVPKIDADGNSRVDGDTDEENDLDLGVQFYEKPKQIEPRQENKGYQRFFREIGETYETFLADYDFLLKRVFRRQKGKGWLSAGYGTFRRTTGETRKASAAGDEMVQRFATLFKEDAVIYDSELWLKDIDQPMRTEVFELLCKLLPEVDSVRLDEKTRTVLFDWHGRSVGLDRLSDGYRTMFAFAVDLMRWMQWSRSDTVVRLSDVSGVVLIDEIDTHLHPQWQRQVGHLLTHTFKNIQFIVTTHSPFVAMSAPLGGVTLLKHDGDKVVAKQDLPNVHGWAVDQVLANLFGLSSVYAYDVSAKINEFRDLRLKRATSGLDADEESRLQLLSMELDEQAPDMHYSAALKHDLDLAAEELRLLKEKKDA